MPQIENLATVTETAMHLRISNRTVYRLIESGQIGAVRVGKQWRIPASELPAIAPVLMTQGTSTSPASR